MAKLTLLLLLALAAIATADRDAKTEFENFKKQNGKKYKDSAEETMRQAIFAENLKKIDDHNKKFDAKQTTYKMAVNKLADMTADERKSLRGLVIPKDFKSPGKRSVPEDHRETRFKRFASRPDAFDWRTQGAVPEVRDQGGCGSCWAFAAVSTLESHQFIWKGVWANLSEQALVDCVYPYSGCQGGWPAEAYVHVKSKGDVLATRDSYPYTGVYPGSCPQTGTDGFSATLQSMPVQFITGENSTMMIRAMTKAVGWSGPITVAIHANSDFDFYSSGIFAPDGTACSKSISDVNHAVTIVGWGFVRLTPTQSQSFWIVRNSWGAGWGEGGYMRLARGLNTCGVEISGLPQYPLVSA